jgi:hypothetical protein
VWERRFGIEDGRWRGGRVRRFVHKQRRVM